MPPTSQAPKKTGPPQGGNQKASSVRVVPTKVAPGHPSSSSPKNPRSVTGGLTVTATAGPANPKERRPAPPGLG